MFLLALVGVAVYLYYAPLASYFETRNDLAARRAEVETLRVAKAELELRLANSTSLEATQREARRAGYVRPGEQLFVVRLEVARALKLVPYLQSRLVDGLPLRERQDPVDLWERERLVYRGQRIGDTVEGAVQGHRQMRCRREYGPDRVEIEPAALVGARHARADREVSVGGAPIDPAAIATAWNSKLAPEIRPVRQRAPSDTEPRCGWRCRGSRAKATGRRRSEVPLRGLGRPHLSAAR